MQMFEKQSTKRSQNEFNCKKGKSAESGYRFGFWFWAGGLFFSPIFREWQFSVEKPTKC